MSRDPERRLHLAYWRVTSYQGLVLAKCFIKWDRSCGQAKLWDTDCQAKELGC